MPFKVKYSDITTYKVDVIVNSLGVKGNVYGKLCKNIITKAKDQELKQYIDKQNNPVGTILVTSAGKLKANKIIHVVTPFKHMDNEKNELLVKAYKDCINKAFNYAIGNNINVFIILISKFNLKQISFIDIR